MALYYMNINAQLNGDHEVHRDTCHRLPYVQNRRLLGEHYYCHTAVAVAKIYDPLADGCYYCSNECHTR